MAEAAKTPDSDSTNQQEMAVETQEAPQAANNNQEQPVSTQAETAAKSTAKKAAEVTGYTMEDLLGDGEYGVSPVNLNRERALSEGFDDAAAAEVARHSNKAKSRILAIATGEVEHPVFEKVRRMEKAKRKAFLSTVSGRFISGMNAEKAGLKRSQKSAARKATSIERIIKIAERHGEVGMEVLGAAVSDAYSAQGFYNKSRMYEFLKETEVKDNDDKDIKVTDLLAKYVDDVEDPVLMAAVQQSVLAELSEEGEFGEASLAKILSELPRPVNAEPVDTVNKKNQDVISGFVSRVEELRDQLGGADASARAKNKVVDQEKARRKEIEDEIDTLSTQLNEARSRVNTLQGEVDGIHSNRSTTLSPEAQQARNLEIQAKQKELSTARDKESDFNTRITRLREKRDSVTESINKMSSGSLESTENLEKVRTEMILLIQRFVSAVKDNINQAGDAIKLDDYKALKELETLVEGLSTQNSSDETEQDANTIKSKLDFEKVLSVGREIAKVQLATAEKRLFKPEELAVALLQKKYVEAGYSPEQSRTMAAIEMKTLERQNNLSDLLAKAQDSRMNRKGMIKRFGEKIIKKTRFVNYKQALRGMARNQDLPEHAANAFAELSPKQSYAEVRDLFKEGKVTRETVTEYMYRLGSLLGPVQIRGEKGAYALKGPKDIAAVEQIINNLSRLTAEMSALEVGEQYREQLKLSENKDADRAELYAKVLKQYNDTQFDQEVALSARASSDAIPSMDTKNRAQQIVRGFMQAAKAKAGSGARKVGGALVWAGKGVGKVAAAPFKLTAEGLKNLSNFALWVARNPLTAAGNVLGAPIRIASWGANKITLAIGRKTYEVSQLAGRAFVALPGIPYTAYKGFSHGVKAAIDSSKLRMMDTKVHWQDERLRVAATEGGHTINSITRDTNREIENLNLSAQRSTERQQSAQDDWDERFRDGSSSRVANNDSEDDNEERAAA